MDLLKYIIINFHKAISKQEIFYILTITSISLGENRHDWFVIGSRFKKPR